MAKRFQMKNNKNKTNLFSNQSIDRYLTTNQTVSAATNSNDLDGWKKCRINQAFVVNVESFDPIMKRPSAPKANA